MVETAKGFSKVQSARESHNVRSTASGNQAGDIGFARQPCRHVVGFSDLRFMGFAHVVLGCVKVSGCSTETQAISSWLAIGRFPRSCL
jgi:hypothetical protein